jgi:2'-5' RNA ligase
MPRRLFVAMLPDAKVRHELTMLQARPEIRAAGGRMVPAKNIHMTLRFLGDEDTSRQGTLKAWLAEFDFEPVTLTLDRVGYWSHAGILWLGPRKTSRALSVALQRLSNQLRALGYRADGRGSKAHVTLARDARAAKHFVFSPVTWRAETMVLVASKRLPQGARYTVLAQSGTAKTARIR